MLKSKPILEPEIKTIIINYLLGKGRLKSSDLIINEFTVGDFSRRVDLALVSSERLLAFEVKSEADSLTRLEGQVDKYLEYFNKVTVVAAPKHISKALELTPSNVAVWEVCNGSIVVRRKGRLQERIGKEQVIDMMTANELAKVLRMVGLTPDSTKRKYLESLILENVPAKTLKAQAILSIRSRYKSRNERFFNKVTDSLSTPEDLKLLSHNLTSKTSTNIRSSITDFLEVLDSIEKKTTEVSWEN